MIGIIKKRFKLILIIAVVVFLGIFAYQNFFAGEKNKKVESTKVRRGTLEEKLTVSGTMDAEEKATLKFQTSGKLTWIGVKEGDYVKKFQTVASLDQRELKMNLDKYLNTYMSERWDFEQAVDDYNYKHQPVTDHIRRIIEQAQFDLNNSVIDVEIKDLAIQLSNLWTPIEGIVTKVGAPYAGVNITPASAEIEIVNPKTVYFSASADQTEVTKIKEGMQGELTLDSYPDTPLTGGVNNISFNPKTGETGTVYAVKFYFSQDNSDYKYRLGMTGDLTFVTSRKENVLYLPLKYVKSQNGKKYVQVKKEGKTEKTYVEIGLETENNVEITKGLTESEVVYD